MKEIRGVCPVIAMPFTDAGEIDYDDFANLAKHLTNVKADGITLFGLASEFHKLVDEERWKLAETFIGIVKPTPTYSMLSVTDHSTEIAVKRAREYQRMGADSLMLLPPFFLSPSIEAIREHMREVLSAVSIPVLVQYVPAQTGVIIPPGEMAGLHAKFPHMMFKIEENPPETYVSELLQLAPTARLLTGYAGLHMITILEMGGVGVMPGCSFTELYLAIQKLYDGGRLEEAKKLHARLFAYIKIWMTDCEYIVGAEKEILMRRGIIKTARCRRPFWKLIDKDYADITSFRQEFAEYGV